MDPMRRPSREPIPSPGRRPARGRGVPDGLPAAPERSRVPRIVVQVTCAPADPPVHALLEAEGFELVSCADAHALLEEVMHRKPDAVIYALCADCHQDMGVLRLLRRAAPEVPLVLLAADDSLDTRKVTQALRPTYFAVCPIDGAELRDVVRSAVRKRGRVV
jgi:AmiR/NasT family two-component response regulator